MTNNIQLFCREIKLDEKEKIQQKVISVYKDTEDLRTELRESNPNYLDVLKKWRNDLENSDHAIVVAGTCKLFDSSCIWIEVFCNQQKLKL